MKVVFLTEYSSFIGFGHLSRTLALADVFVEYKFEVFFLIREWSNEELEISHKHHKVEWKKWDSLKSYLREEDLCIMDTYKVSKDELNELSKNIPYPISISDSKLNFPNKGLVIIGSIYAKQMSNRLPKNIKKLVGPEYIFFRKIFWNIQTDEINPTIKKVVVSLGGFIQNSVLDNIICHILYELNVDEVMVIGKVENKMNENRVQYKGFLSAFDYVREVLSADLMISNGGQSLNESILLGTPTIAISIAKNQDENISSWKKLGVIQACGSPLSLLFAQDFKTNLNLLKNVNVRRTMVRTGRNMIDAQGAFRAFNYIINSNHE